MKLIALLFAMLAAGPIRHGPRAHRQVAITFDACPTQGDGLDHGIVRALLVHDVPATVFISGTWAEAHPAHAQKLAQHFEVGSHGHRHTALDELPYEGVVAELRAAQTAIQRITGARPTLFRPPSVRYDDEVLAAAKAIGLRTVTYDVASGDPDPNLEAAAIVRYVTWKVRNGSIVIFHINGRGYTTATTLPRIVEILRARGYRLVTVSQLLDRKEAP